MAKGITVKVAFHPMYVDYINSRWSYGYNEPIFAKDLNGHIGSVLKLQLRTQPKVPDIRQYEDEKHVVFELPYYGDLNIRYNNYISENGEKRLRKWVRKKFFFDMHEYIMDENLEGRPEIKAAIIGFCDLHDIDPMHYNYDSLKREYYRFRQKEKLNNALKKSTSFAAVLSFFCPLFVSLLIH